MKYSARDWLLFVELVAGIGGVALMLSAAFGAGLATFAAGVACAGLACLIEALVR
jgi:hypothetical protein